jgi:hypothetical protein
MHARLVVRVGHEGDLLRVRVEARRQRGDRAVGEEAVVLAVLVHDGEAAVAAVARAALGDVGDAGVEIALFAEQPLVDHVGDRMRDAAPVGGRRGEGGALQLLLRQHVPQAELDAEAVAGEVGAAGGERLRADHPPVLEARRLGGGFRRLDEGGALHRAEQAGGAEVAQHHARDLPPEALRVARAGEVGHGDRDRLRPRAGDVDHRAALGPRPARRDGGRDEARGGGAERGAAAEPRRCLAGVVGRHRTRPLGLKRKVDAISVGSFAAGTLSGLHCGESRARRADS